MAAGATTQLSHIHNVEVSQKGPLPNVINLTFMLLLSVKLCSVQLSFYSNGGVTRGHTT